VILANAEFTIHSIVNFTQFSESKIYRILRRFKRIKDVADYSRSGRPALYQETFKLELIGFYCQTQPFSKSGRWSFRWAATHLAIHPEQLNATPSKSTIHRIMKENSLKPHQSRYFLHITDPDFFPKMDHLIKLYNTPPRNLYFFDECPGIQILKRLLPDIQTDKTQKRLEEFEYIRNGTTDVFAFLDNKTGEVFAECRADHKTDTFIDIFKRHVTSLPMNEKIHYVMDNLSTHRGYQFCKTVATLSNVSCPPQEELDNLEKRVVWLKSENKRIVIHFTPYHGSWLNMVEFWFGILNKKVLNESYGSIEELKESFESFLNEWNTLHAHPFRWSYDGKGLPTKAVDRFTRILRQAAHQIEISGLIKQLKLMLNLMKDNAYEISSKYWSNLYDVFCCNEAALKERIKNEEGPTKKKKAAAAFNSLSIALKNWASQNMSNAA
jgi:transposase